MSKTNSKKNFSLDTITKIAILGALATVTMLLEFPLWFAPPFYQLDFSEVFVLLGGFALGPLAGAVIELIKVLMNLVINGTITGGIGELANFLIGCAFVIPASWIYKKHKSIKGALLGLFTGSLVMTVVGSALNAFVLLPLYAKIMMPMDALIEMGGKVNRHIQGVTSFVLLAVAPFNLFKGAAVSLITFLLYKRVSPLLHRKFQRS